MTDPLLHPAGSAGTERRNRILELLTQGDTPISGGALARALHVSRQVIVQDIALLRAQQQPILSTYRGYLLTGAQTVSREFRLCHSPEQAADELMLIVDCGGRVETLTIVHPAHGVMTAAMRLGNRVDAQRYLERLADSVPVYALTGGLHCHRISAPSEDILNHIEDGLRARGFLRE